MFQDSLRRPIDHGKQQRERLAARLAGIVPAIALVATIPSWCSAGTLDSDRDGRAELALYERGTLLSLTPLGAVTSRVCGQPGDVPLPGRYSPSIAFAAWSPGTGVWQLCGDTTVLQPWGEPGDLPVPADYDADGLTDFAVFRPSTGEWSIRFNQTPPASTVVRFGDTSSIPLAADIDGDGRADLVTVTRDASANRLIWRTQTSAGVEATFNYGLAGDEPILADFDGDGAADAAVWTPADGMWRIRTATPISVQLGIAGDIPAPLDLDGDHDTDIAVYRPSMNTWFIASGPANPPLTVSFGALGDRLASDSAAYLRDRRAPLDFDGDRRTDFTLLRPTRSSALSFLSAVTSRVAPVIRHTPLGSLGDAAVPADYDGDGITDYAVIAPNGTAALAWHILPSGSQATGRTETVISYGFPTDQIIPADYDGDGKTDLAVTRSMNGAKVWLVRASSGRGTAPISWGLSADRAIAADLDGDRRDDLIVTRTENGAVSWFARTLGGASIPLAPFGAPGDDVLAQDFDGDGKAERAVIRLDGGTKALITELGAHISLGDRSASIGIGSFRGLRRIEPAVWTLSGAQGTFSLLAVSDPTISGPFGVRGDIPLQPVVTPTARRTAVGTSAATPGKLSCSDRSAVSAQPAGFAWQPASRLTVTFPAGLFHAIKTAALVQERTLSDAVLETLRFTTNIDRRRPSFRASLSGGAYPAPLVLVYQDTKNRLHCIDVPAPAQPVP